MSETVLEIKNMNKSFGPIVALKDVNLTVRRGEIHGLIGENGSGKSTITSIAAGMQKATSGEMFYMGKTWNPSSMIEAKENGVAMILQEANTIPGCKVADNLFAGQEDRFSRFGFVNNRRMYEEADKLLDKYGLTSFRGNTPLDALSFEDRKLIELVRSVAESPEILVIDETTTALSMEGRNLLYRLMHGLAEDGKAVIFISHDMDEILEHCTILTVLRDGEIRGEIRKEEFGRPDCVSNIRKLMVGRDIGDNLFPGEVLPPDNSEEVMVFSGVNSSVVKDFSLALHKGEIVGLGGLSGCGMHDVGKMAFGLLMPDTGKITYQGNDILSPQNSVTRGIGYISKDRDTEALILQCSIETNIAMASMGDMRKGTLLPPGKPRELANDQIEKLEIKCLNGKQWVNTLSGGNKQKVSFAKWLAKGSSFIVMDCPTRGVDIGVKQAMYRLINEMKRQGKTILMISEELSELIGMSDRLLIMKDGKIRKEFEQPGSLTETDIIEYMI